MKRATIYLAAMFFLACGSEQGTVAVPDANSATEDIPRPEETRETEDAPERVEPDLLFDSGGQDADAVSLGCQPGEGCFLDACDGNQDCQSGWCVSHMGEDVCTIQCTEECPPGWSCRQVGGAGPDLLFVCVSDVANLCKPCAATTDCKSPGGAEDVCLSYAGEGNFCGAPCGADDDCPWGFSCTDVETVDGVTTSQCVADTGVCPCAAASVKLGLWTPCEVTNEFGSCQGKRTCTADGLTPCDAGVPAQETCDGVDEDCDGEVDEPVLVDGKYQELCDDGNPCTADLCKGADGCILEALTQGECVDGDACTIGDHCEDGVCVGLPIACDDGNPCTDDLCDGLGGCTSVDNTAPCDDGDPCTVADQCSEGSCSGYAMDCDCQTDADCVALDDGDPCTGTLVCNKDKVPYRCELDADTVVTCTLPPGVNPVCAQAVCDPDTAACETVAVNDGFACDDGDACTIGEQCEDTACVAGVQVVCDDGNPCTDDSCHPKTGCVHAPNDGECSDGNACTNGDHCDDGLCVSVGLVDCDDSNPCTADKCLPVVGCEHDSVAGPCDDGNACTAGDSCVNGECVPGKLIVCNDSNPCTDDSCDENGDCVHVPNAAACDDGNACTTGDVCQQGACVFADLIACDDDDPCTTDSCHPTNGCVHSLNAAPCDDGDLCTTGDHCHLGECISAGALACDDSNACTDDACNAQTGCTYEANQAACDDGNACTQDDACAGGWCQPGASLTCDDGNPCTDDSCDPAAGCVNTDNALPCDDGDACTVGDVCQDGACVSGVAASCDDDNPCTDDACDPAAGCVSADNTAPCDDGDGCTLDDTCAGGACAGSPCAAQGLVCWQGGCVDHYCGDGTCDADESYESCLDDCPLDLWLESGEVEWYPVKYPHGTWTQAQGVQVCKDAGLRLWRDEVGPLDDPNWVYDTYDTHNLGGHDIGYKVQNACTSQQEGHTGTWAIFGSQWSQSIKSVSGAANGQQVYLLNKRHHGTDYPNDASYTIVQPQSGAVTFVSADGGGPVSGMNWAIVLCAARK